MTHSQYKQTLVLEDATNSAGVVAFRAIVLHNPDVDVPEAFSVENIFESDNMDNLRSTVKGSYPGISHYRWYAADGKAQDAAGDWSDAFGLLKEKLYDLAKAEGADVRRNMSPMHLVEHRLKAVAAQEAAAERLENDRREKEERAAIREALKTDRADFAAWEQVARKDDALRSLFVTMRAARQSVRDWPKTLADHQEKLAKNPTYTLGWSGDFVEAAAVYEVSMNLVDLFEAGVEPSDMLDHVTQHMLQNAERASSRSTSVMSNLVDDAARAAWSGAFKRLSGRGFW